MTSPALYRSFSTSRRGGFSLVEVMVATLISLIVIGAAVTLFGLVGEKVTAGRAGIETSDHVRAAQDALRQDLQCHTASMLPWESPAAANGYFEIIKGNKANRDSTNATINNDPLTGYTGDYLMFTIRAKDRPFVGRLAGTPVQSQVAEVVWFLSPTTNSQGQQTSPVTYTLYRRMFLVLPGLQLTSGANFFDNNDISAHAGGTGMLANSLADLTYRENRFGHDSNPSDYPFLVSSVTNNSSTIVPFSSSSPRFGEDAVLTNVLSFDVKVWDPNAQVLQDNSNPSTPKPLVPSDPGYSSGVASSPPTYGAYVDLNYNNGNFVSNSYFSSAWVGSGQKSGTLATSPANGQFPLTWDSWSSGYEYYAGNSFAAYGQDKNACNGFDDSTQRGVSAAGQRQTSPPYPVPLRGIRVKIRVYEPVARQVREVTVDETFTPD